jgi:hypothetical protein
MSNLGYFALGLGLLVVYLVAMAAVLFGAAGTLAVPMFWIYLVLFRGPVRSGQRRRLSAEPGSREGARAAG